MKNKQTQTELTAIAQEILAAPTACAELKEATSKWLAALDTADEAAAAAALAQELEEDVMKVDDVIAFFSSPAAEGIFGKEQAAALLAGEKAHKAAGGVYCNCPGCSAGSKLLLRKAELFD